ncbi:alpha-L RNA-binding motif-containing protein [Stipitochalara longipes BDJ]|nr:alpha-L RNA-binding motif-containing protein [Stipitochalara longipes BDJ]
MTRKRFHGLKRVKFRATWNKYNLFNLSRLKAPRTDFMTYYQQKWSAKSITRAYHGEHIREGQWERMFTPLLNSVIPMDHRYLAEHDGSEQAAGRGSGLEKPLDLNKISFGKNQIPYMHMTYAPIERRLDTAIFRALFASSVRQARQFVIHGQVRVNGKRIPYPGYLLNPGDMFQVEPDRVLFATGAPKIKVKVQAETRRYERRISRQTNLVRNAALSKAAERRRAREAKELADDTVELVPSKPKAARITLGDPEVRKLRQRELLKLIRQIEDKIGNKKIRRTGKRKQELRALLRRAKANVIFIQKKPVEELDSEIKDITQELLGFTEEVETPDKTPVKRLKPESAMDQKQKAALEAAIARIRENPADTAKPYATPWRPRPYMSAFAFIPRYLEVNHNICSAVYLRHPVARPGLAEVPTPFPAETQQLAFNWYLRRR